MVRSLPVPSVLVPPPQQVGRSLHLRATAANQNTHVGVGSAGFALSDVAKQSIQGLLHNRLFFSCSSFSHVQSIPQQLFPGLVYRQWIREKI